MVNNVNKQKTMLNIGCGHNYLEGWINIDDNPDNNIKKLDMTLGLTDTLHFKPKCVDVIYDRRFFEKLRLGSEVIQKFLINYKYILKDDGLLRIVIPDESFREKSEKLLKALGFNNLEITEMNQLSEKKYNYANSKIPCYILVFFDYETTKKSLDFFTQYSDRLDIRIVENHSDFTESHIKPYIMSLLEQETISNYYLFDENIGFNAIEKVMVQDSEYLNEHEYFMITDGDLTSKDSDWLDEQINILKNNPEVIVSGVKLDMSNLPSEDKYPGANNWVPPAKEIEGKNYLDGQTGWVLTMLKTDYFFLILRLIKQSGEQLSDFRVYKYALTINKKWVRTKKTEAYHLTWDTYSQLDHPYTKWKTSHTYTEIWDHKKYCGYNLFTKNK